jgi:hypothetical protein
MPTGRGGGLIALREMQAWFNVFLTILAHHRRMGGGEQTA